MNFYDRISLIFPYSFLPFCAPISSSSISGEPAFDVQGRQVGHVFQEQGQVLPHQLHSFLQRSPFPGFAPLLDNWGSLWDSGRIFLRGDAAGGVLGFLHGSLEGVQKQLLTGCVHG